MRVGCAAFYSQAMYQSFASGLNIYQESGPPVDNTRPDFTAKIRKSLFKISLCIPFQWVVTGRHDCTRRSVTLPQNNEILFLSEVSAIPSFLSTSDVINLILEQKYEKPGNKSLLPLKYKKQLCSKALSWNNKTTPAGLTISRQKTLQKVTKIF